MVEVSREVLQDTIIALESQIYEEERNSKVHGVSDVSGNNLRVMLSVLRNELSSREMQ